jgi:hypothetical protein
MALEKWDLYSSYYQIMKTPAFKDIKKFMGKRKKIAMGLAKNGDNAEARAAWKLVDEFYAHLLQVRKEGVDEYQRNQGIK